MIASKPGGTSHTHQAKPFHLIVPLGGTVSRIGFEVYSLALLILYRWKDMEAAPLETLTNQLCQEWDAWFSIGECETLARTTGFIQRSTSRLTGSDFFKSADGGCFK